MLSYSPRDACGAGAMRYTPADETQRGTNQKERQQNKKGKKEDAEVFHSPAVRTPLCVYAFGRASGIGWPRARGRPDCGTSDGGHLERSYTGFR